MGVYDYWGENHLVVEETTNTSNIQDDNSRPLTTWLAVTSLEKKLSKGTYTTLSMMQKNRTSTRQC
jgi:hypothetical protein